jgi:hypothetical protein
LDILASAGVLLGRILSFPARGKVVAYGLLDIIFAAYIQSNMRGFLIQLFILRMFQNAKGKIQNEK